MNNLLLGKVFVTSGIYQGCGKGKWPRLIIHVLTKTLITQHRHDCHKVNLIIHCIGENNDIHTVA